MNTPNTSVLKPVLQNDDLAQQIAALRADVSKLMTTVSDDVADGLGQAGRQLGLTGRDARATATRTVLDHPLAAVGIAVGVGLLLGLVARKA